MTRLEMKRIKSQLRRARLTDLGYCINGESHGKATHGVRCEHCDTVHKRTRTSSYMAKKLGAPPMRVLIVEFAATITIDTRRRESA